MVAIGMWLLFLSIMFWIGMRRGWKWIHTKWYRWLIVLGGPLAILAIEAVGGCLKVGRQPWIFRGFMRTAEAATSSNQVDIMLILFAIVYIILGIGTSLY